MFLEDSGFTDDTVLTCAVADSLLNGQEVLFTLREWPRKILISPKVGGYGKRFMEWVAKPNPQPPYQSFGNGSAMRVSPCAWLADSIDEVRSLAIQVTDVTHDHPEGIKELSQRQKRSGLPGTGRVRSGYARTFKRRMAMTCSGKLTKSV